MHNQSTRLAGMMAILASVAWAGRSAEAGYVTGSVASATGVNVNLTTAGPIDWVHYGIGGGGDSSDGEPVHKAGGTIIGGLTANVPIKSGTTSTNTYSWSNGNSPVSGSDTNGSGTNDLGPDGKPGVLTLALASSSSPLEARFYIGADLGISGVFTATLNDGSGASFSTSSIAGHEVVTVDFASNAASSLTVSYTALPPYFGGFEGIEIDAVTVGFAPSTVPEPASMVLVLFGLVGATGYGMRRRLRAASA